MLWDINTKFSPVNVPMSFQLSIKFGRHSLTQEIYCFLVDVQIILVSLFEFFDYIKVAKNAGAFLSRCSELFALDHWHVRVDSIPLWSIGLDGKKQLPETGLAHKMFQIFFAQPPIPSPRWESYFQTFLTNFLKFLEAGG